MATAAENDTQVVANAIGMALMALLTYISLYFLGFESARRYTNAIVVRATYIAFMVLLGYIVFWSNSKLSPHKECADCTVSFQLHPILMSIAWVVMAAEGAMAYVTPPFASCGKTVAKRFHAIFHFCTVACSLAGVTIAFVNHHEKKVNHLNSHHSWFGFATLTFSIIQFILGFFAFYISDDERWKARFLPVHKFAGVTAYLTACATICLGLSEYVGTDPAYGYHIHVKQVAGILVWVLAVHVVAGLFMPKGKSRDEAPLLASS